MRCLFLKRLISGSVSLFRDESCGDGRMFWRTVEKKTFKVDLLNAILLIFLLICHFWETRLASTRKNDLHKNDIKMIQVIEMISMYNT